MKKPLPVHPFILAVCPILFLYLHNLKDTFIPLAKVAFYLGGMTVFSLMLLYLLNYLLNSIVKAGIVVSSFYVLIFYFPLWDKFTTFDLNNSRWLPLGICVLLLIAILLFVIIYLLVRKNREVSAVASYLNYFSYILLIFIVGNNMYPLIFNNQIHPKINHTSQVDGKPRNIESPPNIYYIILDAYARQDILRDYYHFDNSDFLSFLKDEGFYVASQSRANYNLTVLSLASSLNSVYLEDIKKEMGEGSSNKKPLVQIIASSNIRQFLQKYGYKFLAFSSGYYPTEIENADQYIISKSNFEFESMLLNRTLPGILFRKFCLNLEKRIHAERILNILATLPEIAKQREPAFIFAHLLSPHPPFVFSKTELSSNYVLADGSHLHFNKEATRQKYIKAYCEQLLFINNKIKKLVKDILRNSAYPPIIILQSDHGPRLTGDIKESTGILNAIYLRDNEKELYDTITPVNTFRVIRKRVFFDDIDLLSDRSFFSVGVHTPYKYYELKHDELHVNKSN